MVVVVVEDPPPFHELSRDLAVFALTKRACFVVFQVQGHCGSVSGGVRADHSAICDSAGHGCGGEAEGAHLRHQHQTHQGFSIGLQLFKTTEIHLNFCLQLTYFHVVTLQRKCLVKYFARQKAATLL